MVALVYLYGRATNYVTVTGRDTRRPVKLSPRNQLVLMPPRIPIETCNFIPNQRPYIFTIRIQTSKGYWITLPVAKKIKRSRWFQNPYTFLYEGCEKELKNRHI